MNLLRRASGILAASESDGITASEFAICATVLLTILAGTVDIGLLLYTGLQLDTALNAGAQYAVNNAAMVKSEHPQYRDFECCEQFEWYGRGD